MQNQIWKKISAFKNRRGDAKVAKLFITCLVLQSGWGVKKNRDNCIRLVLTLRGKRHLWLLFFSFYTQIHLLFLSSFCSSSSNPWRCWSIFFLSSLPFVPPTEHLVCFEAPALKPEDFLFFNFLIRLCWFKKNNNSRRPIAVETTAGRFPSYLLI